MLDFLLPYRYRLAFDNAPLDRQSPIILHRFSDFVTVASISTQLSVDERHYPLGPESITNYFTISCHVAFFIMVIILLFKNARSY